MQERKTFEVEKKNLLKYNQVKIITIIIIHFIYTSNSVFYNPIVYNSYIVIILRNKIC